MERPIQNSKSRVRATGFLHRPNFRQIFVVMLLGAFGVVVVQGEFVMSGRQEVALINEIRRNIRDGYVDGDRAEEVDRALAGWAQSAGRFGVTLGPVFAFRLTRYLQELAHDRHLLLMYSVLPIHSDKEGQPNPIEVQRGHNQEVSDHFGFERVEVMDGHIGYIELRRFADPESAAGMLSSVMDRVESTRALIIDLRRNHGGSPGMGVLLASYFFEKPVHWVDLKSRNHTEELWTFSSVSGARYLDRPVYLLTSRHTFSAGEGFSYHMRNLKRAMIIGEPTGGGANPGVRKRLDDHFWMFLPTMRALSPITGTNWNGVGVQPDLIVPADEALSTAIELAKTSPAPGER
jgi:peptidase S41-like protein